MQIQISWLLQKPTDLDLHCLQRQGISRLSRSRVKMIKLISLLIDVSGGVNQMHHSKYIEDIQMFGVNMTFISSSEVKKCIFHECRRHE